jgi:hypothetical protein
MYDIRKANEQLKNNKELYNPNMHENSKENSPNKLISIASDKDKEKIKEIFNKYDNLSEDELRTQKKLEKKAL